jgi:hypothetical protein
MVEGGKLGVVEVVGFGDEVFWKVSTARRATIEKKGERRRPSSVSLRLS